jgi:hypothetical protein
MDKVALAKSNVVIKTARNIKRAYTADDAYRGAYREDVRLGLERQRLITESYQETERQRMVLRRARALGRTWVFPMFNLMWSIGPRFLTPRITLKSIRN